MERKTHNYTGRLGVLFQTVVQTVVLIGVWWGCERLVQALDLPLPGGVVGMLLLIVLLGLHVLPVRWFARGAGGLLNNMLLFFVPAVMTLRDHPELLGVTGLKLLAVIFMGILSVMAGTALIVELHYRARCHHVR